MAITLYTTAQLFFGAFFFYTSKLLAPLHVPIALVFVYCACRRAYHLYRARRVQTGLAIIKKKTVRQLLVHKFLIVSCFCLCTVWYMFVSLVPTDAHIFCDLSRGDIERIVIEDTIHAAQLVDMLTVTGDALLNNVALYKDELTTDEQESLKREWNAFLGVAIASESVTDRHRYFPQISLIEETELQAQSFTISYALYMLKFAYFHRIIDAVWTNNEVRTILNEYVNAFGSVDSYDDVTGRFLQQIRFSVAP